MNLKDVNLNFLENALLNFFFNLLYSILFSVSNYTADCDNRINLSNE